MLPFLLKINLYVTGSSSKKGYCYIVGQSRPDTMIEDYQSRWENESLFSSLKKRGFDLESCRLTDAERTDKFTGLSAIAFCWSYSESIQQSTKNLSELRKPGLVNHGQLRAYFIKDYYICRKSCSIQ